MTNTPHKPNNPGKERKMQDALAYHLSLQVALAIHAVPNRCFENAWRAFITLPEIFRPDGKFIEGWFVIDLDRFVVMNEHGWCERANGTIIDPSVLLLVTPDQPVYYFPGVVRSWEETEALENQLFPYVRFDGTHGDDGLGHPGYKAAHDAARQKVAYLSGQSQPPKKPVFLTAQDLQDDLSKSEHRRSIE